MKRVRRPGSGNVAKVTVSLRVSELEVMRRLARRRHGGNLSGAFGEVVQHAARLEAMDQVLAELPPPSPEGVASLQRELTAPLEPPRKRRAPRKTAAA